MDAISLAQARWGIRLERRRSGRDEWVGPCPFCHDGEDRFHVWTRGNYWCRQCGMKGFVDEKEGRKLTPEDMVEIRLRALERKQKEQEERLSALERMHHCTDHLAYHRNLDVVPGAREYWDGEGLFRDWQNYYQVGYCGRCPSDKEGRASYTIPVFDGGQLVNIRHRLVGESKDKYRPHIAGLGACLFNADLLDAHEMGIIVVEGEKKAMVCRQYDLAAVGIAGQRTWRDEWSERFDYLDLVYIALDPDATASAYALARKRFPGRAKVVNLPCKPDDFFAKYGGTPEQFKEFLRAARSCAN